MLRIAAAIVAIAGLAAPAAITASAQCEHRDVTIPTTDSLSLPGILTLPAQPGAPQGQPAAWPNPPAALPPIAVLEQGSGVQDKDATIGANKFFVQLADGLCARGVASLRFDRRPKASPENFKLHADLDHEIVIDAAAALAFAQTLPAVDPQRVFLVGHSLGAELAPDSVALRLQQKPGSVAGVALLSGIARPANVVLDEQIRVLGKAQGGSPEQLAQITAAWDAVFARALDPATPPDTPLGVGAHIPASYWRDWAGRDPVRTMNTLHIPMLVVRGTKDSNAPHADFALLAAAATTPGSASREFDGLNHLYFPIAGEPNGMDVMTPGTISPAVLDFVAAWLRHPA